MTKKKYNKMFIKDINEFLLLSTLCLDSGMVKEVKRGIRKTAEFRDLFAPVFSKVIKKIKYMKRKLRHKKQKKHKNKVKKNQNRGNTKLSKVPVTVAAPD